MPFEKNLRQLNMSQLACFEKKVDQQKFGVPFPPPHDSITAIFLNQTTEQVLHTKRLSVSRQPMNHHKLNHPPMCQNENLTANRQQIALIANSACNAIWNKC